ncbi:unnamed protein product, partial [Polarella glacialis]
ACEAARQGGAVDSKLVERIVRHNYHEVERPFGEDSRTEEAEIPPRCGLWPLAAVVNHSLSPNVTRSFLGHTACYRLVRDVAAGEELVDNYIDPRLPREERAMFLARVHGIRDEGPDKFDAPEALFLQIQRRLTAAQSSLVQEEAAEAWPALEAATVLCGQSGLLDPAFTDVLWALADLAGQRPEEHL